LTSTFRRVHGWLAQFTGVSAIIAALGFNVTVALFGPELATGLLFYAAETEAVPTPLPHPWGPVGLTLGLGACLTVASWVRRQPLLGWLGFAAGLIGLAQGVAQILALMEAARP
jgi:hypothetical protein